MKGDLSIPVKNHMVTIMPPTAAGNQSSDVFGMKDDGFANILITTGTVTSACTITVEECTAAAGTSATAIVFNYYKTSTAGSETWGTLTAATVGGIATGTTNNLMWSIPIDASQLSDGYPYVRVSITTASTLISMVAVFGGSRYASDTSSVARLT